ncbi:MAG: Smr/MutS family protein, partial [Gemmatimonadaceae bacterium]
KLRERERTVERESRKDARKHLLDARTTIDQIVRDLKRVKDDAVDEAAREARRRIEQIVAKQGERLDQLEREESNVQRRSQPPAESVPLQVGDLVTVTPLEGRIARVVDLRADEIVIALGAVKVSYPRAALRRAADHQKPVEPVPAFGGDLPEVHAPTEIDVRGMRAGEIDDTVMQALDAAIRADLRSLRIIHGKGTGALRERVGEMLQKDTRVRSFRLGLWNEGGAGVTIADL